MRTTTLWTVGWMLLLSATVPALAQEPTSHDHGVSPYTGLLDREIKAFSEDEVEDLLAGEGMGLALAAELNGYPGPKHVLELADSLALTPEQLAETQGVMAAMQEAARRLGKNVLEEERALDRAFADGTVDLPALTEATTRIAALRGKLRAVHLAAHLAVTDLLTRHQVHRYQTLRGYAAASHDHRDR